MLQAASSKICKLSYLERLCSHACARALFDQFKHGAFALTQLFGHREQFWLVQQQPKPRALPLSSAALAVAAVA